MAGDLSIVDFGTTVVYYAHSEDKAQREKVFGSSPRARLFELKLHMSLQLVSEFGSVPQFLHLSKHLILSSLL